MTPQVNLLETIGELFVQFKVTSMQLEAANKRIAELEPKPEGAGDDQQSRNR